MKINVGNSISVWWKVILFYMSLTKNAPTTNPMAREKKKKEYYVYGTCWFEAKYGIKGPRPVSKAPYTIKVMQ